MGSDCVSASDVSYYNFLQCDLFKMILKLSK